MGRDFGLTRFAVRLRGSRLAGAAPIIVRRNLPAVAGGMATAWEAGTVAVGGSKGKGWLGMA